MPEIVAGTSRGITDGGLVDMLRDALDKHGDKLDALGADVAMVKMEHIESEQDEMSTKMDGLTSRMSKLEASRVSCGHWTSSVP